jgi:transcriptional regulator with XRE-family HTH domain
MRNAMKYPEFASWLTERYINWQCSTGKRQTITQFAEWTGIRKATMSQWLCGKSRPRPEFAFLLAKKLGIDVYAQLGMEKPDQTLFDIMACWENMSDARRKELAKVLAKPSTRKNGT